MECINFDAIKHGIRVAAMCHNIGKTHINQIILNKPGKLTEGEKEHVKEHVVYSVKEMKMMDFNKASIDIVRYHHENFDGSGYPEGLAGEEIPIGARILRIVDMYDALTYTRCYRVKLTHDEAMKIIEGEIEHFDPVVYKLFLKYIHTEAIKNQNLEIQLDLFLYEQCMKFDKNFDTHISSHNIQINHGFCHYYD